MARPLTTGVYRPPCPRGHEGGVRLDGRARTKDRLFERTRFRCVPKDAGEKAHVYLGSMPSRREQAAAHAECPSCERPFHRAEGLAGGWRFSFVVREIAIALARVGRGDSYRLVSREMRELVLRKSTRGRRKGHTSKDGHLAINYMDAFARLVIDQVAPAEWPPIVLLDALPIRVRDHSVCCKPLRAKGMRPPQHADLWGPPAEESVVVTDAAGKKKTVRRPKVPHTAPIKEIGRILVAVGMRHPGDLDPKPVLTRFMGGGDQESWAEFLRALPGQPEWVVSDRDTGIIPAVVEVWGDGRTTHYFCEQHIAKNGAEKAVLDGVDETDTDFWAIFERAQFGPIEWAQLEGAATVLKAQTLLGWMIDTKPTMDDQWANRRQFWPRSAAACEDVIRRLRSTLNGREPHFRNADRLNILLALALNEIGRRASVNAYSKVIREAFAEHGGRVPGDWFELRDPKGTSSMEELVADAQVRGKSAKAGRSAPKKAANHRRRRAEYEAERERLGLLPSPRGKPRLVRAQGSVAGKTIANFWWLVAEWHATLNGSRRPEDVPAGSGDLIWWKCDEGPDHEWQAQVRSRSIRGTGCPFCTNRRIAPSESLAVTHSDIAAQWHPTRNPKTPEDFTYGSHHEAWWQCSIYKTHVWKARISSRTSMLSGCSLCARLAGKGGALRADAEANAVA